MRADAWLVRHGQSMTNCGGPALPPASVALTEYGQYQAQRFAAALPYPPDLLVTSGFLRSIQSAAPIAKRWPEVRQAVWDIGEITYLSPARVLGMTFDERKHLTDQYWHCSDPWYRDGDDAETFSEFVERLMAFDTALRNVPGFIVVIGHGQFLRGFQLGRQIGYSVSEKWMRKFREMEKACPLKNFEILRL